MRADHRRRHRTAAQAMSLRERLGLEHPIIGAGLGGGLSRDRLTVAIGEAGGLRPLGIMPPPMLAAAPATPPGRSARPGAGELLLPLPRPGALGGGAPADARVAVLGG